MKNMILAAAIGLSSLTLAGCVSESVSYEDGGYNSRPRDYAERYNRYDRNERWRGGNDYSGRRESGRNDWNDEDRSADRRDRDRPRDRDRDCRNDPRCEVPEYNPERPGYYRRG